MIDLPKPFMPAILREGCLLNPEISKLGGGRKSRDTEFNFQHWASRIVAEAQQIVRSYPLSPWGPFCEEHEVPEAFKRIDEYKRAAIFLTALAAEQRSSWRVRVDLYPIRWQHTNPVFQRRVAEMIASKLIDLREAYTTTDMSLYRIRLLRAKGMDKLLGPPTQVRLVRDAILATEDQRQVMVAIYGDKVPVEWLDPATGKLRADVKLDFGPIDAAIRHFCPNWKPPS